MQFHGKNVYGGKSVWGPPKWYWLHSAAIAHPDHPTLADRRRAHAQFWAFVSSLPCEECRIHARDYARRHPPDFSSSDAYQTWAWRFHNAVNQRLGKPIMSAKEYREVYAEELARKRYPAL